MFQVVQLELYNFHTFGGRGGNQKCFSDGAWSTDGGGSVLWLFLIRQFIFDTYPEIFPLKSDGHPSRHIVILWVLAKTENLVKMRANLETLLIVVWRVESAVVIIRPDILLLG